MAPWYEVVIAGAYLGLFCGIVYGAYCAVRWCAFRKPNLTAAAFLATGTGLGLAFGELYYWPGLLVMIGLYVKYSALDR